MSSSSNHRRAMQNTRDSEELATSYQRGGVENEDASLYDYDVFLSFRGPDTRASFTDVLYEHLCQAGLRVFRDDDELKLGDMIDKILLAIDNSKLCIPIFSKTFAQSKWCLWEVTRMVELQKHILPIFYDVTVGDVNLETPVYNKFMAEHVKKSGEDEVKKWKQALKMISALQEKQVLNTGYTAFCESFAKELLVKLKPKRKIEIDTLIGLEDQTQRLMQLLDIDSTGVRFIGIYGMGGIGKTTLAKDIFNKIADKFDGCCFLDDIRESFRRGGTTYLLEKLLNSLKIPTSGRDPDYLPRLMEECFRSKKILIILDDVDQWEQIGKLAGKSNWFGSGSRIIVTSRDKSVMERGDGKLSDGEVRDFEMEPLGHDYALQLFNRHAFMEGIPSDGFEELSTKAASLMGGLPLALKIIGSLLYKKRREIWVEVIEKLKEIPESDVKKRLRISYDALDQEHQQIYLDIACFFVGSLRTYPVYMWKACKFCPLSGLEILSSMSLIKVSDDGKISMHDQLRDLGRDIVRDESINIPAKRSRLWEDDKARKVLMSKKDKEIVEALRIDGYCAIDLNQTEIGSLENLRFLDLRQPKLKGEFDDLLPSLRWLSYHFDKTFEDTTFGMTSLVILEISFCTINANWTGWSQLKNAKSLKVLDLTGAKQLTRTPYFPEGATLERLVLKQCAHLEAIDGSIGNLKCLKYFNLEECNSLGGLPEETGQLKSLHTLSVSGSSQTFTIPESIGNLVELRSLALKSLHIREIPSSFGKLRSLVDLDMAGSKFDSLPDSIEGLASLEKMSLANCDKVEKLPHTLGALKSLVQLNLSYSGLVELPPSVGELAALQNLQLSHCFRLEQVPDPLGRSKSLVELDLTFTGIVEMPESIGELGNLEKLTLSNCSKLRKLPAAIGDLKSLVKFHMSQTGVTELPESIGGLENLREIWLAHCRQLITLPKSIGALKKLKILNAESSNLSGGLPDEIAGLSSLRTLDLSFSRVRQLPPSINQLHLLDQLSLYSCDEFEELPDLPTGLNLLLVSGQKSLHTVHDLSKLQSLATLYLICSPKSRDSDFGMSMLSAMVELRLSHPVITEFPVEFGNLTRLKALRLDCENLKIVAELPPNLEKLYLLSVKGDLDLPNLPELKNLRFLEVKEWSVGGTLGLRLPSSLRDLYVIDCAGLVSLPAVPHLKELRNLHLLQCKSLTEIPGLGKLESLQYLVIEGCESLTQLENMAELKDIQNIRIVSCKDLCVIEGIDSSKISRTPGANSQEIPVDSAKEVNTGERYDISSLLSSPRRDFLIRRDGRQVNIDFLKGKKVCLYFGPFWRTLDAILRGAYKVLCPRGDFEVVYVSELLYERPFNDDFRNMLWLAIPFSDQDKRGSLRKLFKVRPHDMPQLWIFDENGNFLTAKGFEIIVSYGHKAYPFTPERIKELESPIEDARRNQSLTSIFKHACSDFVLLFDGSQVPVSELEGKVVAIYFSSSSYKKNDVVIPRLRDICRELKSRGESFEIVWAPIEAEYDSYHQVFGKVSSVELSTRWFRTCFKLYFYFNVSSLPELAIIGRDGKTIQSNIVESVIRYGAKAYPFAQEMIVKAREEIERTVISSCRNSAVTNRGEEVCMSDLTGKNILLYLSTSWGSRSRAFLPKLIKAYHKIKAIDNALEVILLSLDDDEVSFREYLATMPWLALPFKDQRIVSIYRMLAVEEIPKLVAIGPAGQVITKEAKTLLDAYGSEAYPFTDKHITDIAKLWPTKLSHALHQHALALAERNYVCDKCDDKGHVWSYCCKGCDFDLHPGCALPEGKWETPEECGPCVGLRTLLRGGCFQPSPKMCFNLHNRGSAKYASFVA